MTLFESLQDVVAMHLHLLTPVADAWQPTDYLPDLMKEDWSERLAEFRSTARELPDDLLVVLVGNMITEEALPNYSVTIQSCVQDLAANSEKPWGVWLRGWTAEENRHGDLLNAYLRLTGRVDMKVVEQTVHHLIRNGFTPGCEDDDRAGLIYAAFQERATRVSHGNLAALALEKGERNIARICRKIATDETRHEVFYTRIVAEMFERDPEPTLLAYRKMLRGLISMPGARMDDGRDPNLFDHFATAAQRTGVYTSRDYASIIRHLNSAWFLEGRTFSGAAAKVRDYLCRQPERYENLASEIEERATGQSRHYFSWLPQRAV